MPTAIDPSSMIGGRYGRLVVQATAPRAAGERGELKFRCACDCGNTVVARGSRLRSGYTASCGCVGYRRDGEQHAKARTKVPPKRRRQIAKRGAAAAAQRRRKPTTTAAPPPPSA